MQYLLLIYGNERDWDKQTPAEMTAAFKEYEAFTVDIIKKDQHRGGNALQPVSTATTVRVANGKTVVTDGPFAETKEQLGGYYLVEARDLDEATALAARIPAARYGCVEVRPVMVMPTPQP
jgi:hypothetical protein